MYLLYVDASGVAEVGASPKLYCIVGVCVHEGTWFALERRLNGLKNRYSCSGESFELHTKDLVARCVEQNLVPGFRDLDRRSRRAAVLEVRDKFLATLSGESLKKHRKLFKQTEAFVHLTAEERDSLINDALDLVATHDGIRLFGEVVDKDHHSHMGGEEDVVRSSFTQLVSRFDQFLSAVNRIDPIAPQKGLLIMDNEPAHARRFADLLSRFRSDGHPFGVVNHVIETPLFVDSRSAGGIQLADVCAYTTRRYVEKGGADGSSDGARFHQIFPSFHRGQAKLHGLRHYCARGSCQCAVCRERGHSITITSSTDTTTMSMPASPSLPSKLVGSGIPPNSIVEPLPRDSSAARQ